MPHNGLYKAVQFFDTPNIFRNRLYYQKILFYILSWNKTLKLVNDIICHSPVSSHLWLSDLEIIWNLWLFCILCLSAFCAVAVSGVWLSSLWLLAAMCLLSPLLLVPLTFVHVSFWNEMFLQYQCQTRWRKICWNLSYIHIFWKHALSSRTKSERGLENWALLN